MNRVARQSGGAIIYLMAGHHEAAIMGLIGFKIKTQRLRMRPSGARHPPDIDHIIDVLKGVYVFVAHGHGKNMLRGHNPP